MVKKEKFQKILYKEQPYPLNYVADEFLSDIIINEKTIPYDYWVCVKETGAISLEISIVVIFAMIFKYLLLVRNYSSVYVVSIVLSSLLFAATIFVFVNGKKSTAPTAGQLSFYIVRGMIVTSILYALSPVLQTLTMAYSYETILALIIMCSILHLYSFDYAFANGYSEDFRCAIPLNSMICASVLAGSQLSTAIHAFTIIYSSIVLFGIFPILYHRYKVSFIQDSLPAVQPGHPFSIKDDSKTTNSPQKGKGKLDKGHFDDEDLYSAGSSSSHSSYDEPSPATSSSEYSTIFSTEEDDKYDRFSIVVIVFCGSLLFQFSSKLLFIVFVGGIFFLTFLIPYVITYFQSNIKHNIRGPWDEALIPAYVLESNQ